MFLIEDGEIVKTIHKNKLGKLQIGSKLNIVKMNGKNYIITDLDYMPEDNVDCF